MANNLNQCNFIGRLGKDPECKTLNNGTMLTSFSIACGEQWRDKATGEKKEKTEWINCVAFGKTAEIIGEYVKKGQQIYISGKMQTDKYEKEGQTVYSTKINVNNMEMLGGKQEGQPQPQQPQQQPRQSSGTPNKPAASNEPPMDFDSEIPF